MDPELTRRFLRAHRLSLHGSEPLQGQIEMVEALGLLLERHNASRHTPLRLGKERKRIEETQEFIEDHLEAPLTLAEIAGASGLSRYHFLRVFKNEVGQTPFAYLSQRRVERARGLLRRGMPISQAAFAAGFADQAHLSRRFKQVVGVTPGEFVRGSAPRRPASVALGRRRFAG